jgi:acetyl-CoA/propionyl-CoA carboxylase biotin carboxyl carrier protein
MPPATAPLDTPGAAAPDAGPLATRNFTAEVGGRRFEVALRYAGGPPAGAAPAPVRRPRKARGGSGGGLAGANEVLSPMQGTVLKVLVEAGQAIAAGTVVCIVEAMKMENEIAAHRDGTVAEVRVAEGQGVAAGDVVAIVE